MEPIKSIIKIKKKFMLKFMFNYAKENPKDFIESIATVGMLLATTYMFYFLGYVFFGA
tara:strand:- start:562 stop:735 length:174 start_codon:yes stop_codon:yes gene_type:complete